MFETNSEQLILCEKYLKHAIFFLKQICVENSTSVVNISPWIRWRMYMKREPWIFYLLFINKHETPGHSRDREWVQKIKFYYQPQGGGGNKKSAGRKGFLIEIMEFAFWYSERWNKNTLES